MSSQSSMWATVSSAPQRTRNLYRLYGEFAARRAKWLIAGSLLICALFIAGWVRINIHLDIRSAYTPGDSPTEGERKVYLKFYNESEPYLFHLLVYPVATAAAPSMNMMDAGRIDQLPELINLMMFDCQTEYEGRSLSLLDLCQPHCQYNEPVNLFQRSLQLEKDRLAKKQTPSNFDASLTYPVATIALRDFFMAKYLFGVRLNNTRDFVTTHGTPVANVSMVSLHYRADNATRKMQAWERGALECIHRWNAEHATVNVNVYGEAVSTDETVAEATKNTPLFILGFTFMVLFIITTTTFTARLRRQCVSTTRNVLIALLTVITPTLAILAGYGAYFWSGDEITPGSLGLLPFLVLAVGVDDAFLLIHAWQKHSNRASADGRIDRVTQLGNTLYDVGPSITITSVTTVLAFSVEIFHLPVPWPALIGQLQCNAVQLTNQRRVFDSVTTQIRVLRLYCLSAAICLTFDFVLQLVLFLPLMLLVYTWQPQSSAVAAQPSYHQRLPPVDFAVGKDPLGSEQSVQSDSLADERWRKCRQALSRGLTRYSTLLCSVSVRLVLLLTYVLYIAVGLFGLQQMRPINDLQLLYGPDDHMRKSVDLAEQHIWSEYYEVHVFIDSPFDPLDAADVAALDALNDDIRTVKYYRGDEFRYSWVDAFNIYYSQLSEMERRFVTLDDFFSTTEYESWKHNVRMGSQVQSDGRPATTQVRMFYFTIAFRDVGANERRLEAIKALRDVLAKHPHLHASAYAPFTYLLDIIDSLVHIALQTVAITIGVMALVCCLFIPSVFTVLIAVLNIVSVCVGVVGFNALIGYNLDVAMVVLTLMTVGFSVDYTAHVITHYYHSGCLSVVPDGSACSRLRYTLSGVAWPTLQAGLSTLLIALSLIPGSGHVSEAFMYVVMWVVLFGLCHALCFIPALLVSLPASLTAPSTRHNHKS